MYLKRLKAILKTQLSARHKAKAINTYATVTELQNLDIKTRTLLTEFRAQSIDSTYQEEKVEKEYLNH